MAGWVAKCLAEIALSRLPGGDGLYYLLQRYLTRSLSPNERYINSRLKWCGQHLNHYANFTRAGGLPLRVLELGTGWFPTVPIGMSLCGAENVVTVDIKYLIREDCFRDMAVYLANNTCSKLAGILPQVSEERFCAFQKLVRCGGTASKLLREMNITCWVGDARQTDFENGAFDLIVSNTTLEHIERGTLDGLFSEFRRILRACGIMSHLIDMSDHYSHTDRSISPYHFLKYEDNVWQRINNHFLYQNRMRVCDYRALHRENRFSLLYEEDQRKHAPELKDHPLASIFQNYSSEDLAATSVLLVSQKQG